MTAQIDSTARREALYQYAAAFDRHSETEQRSLGRGLVHLAEEAHQLARIALNAWLAEQDNPTPEAR